MYNYRLKTMHRVSSANIEYNPKCQTSLYSPYVLPKNEVNSTKEQYKIVSMNEDNFQTLRTNLDQLKEYIFCFEQQFSNYSNLLVEIEDANDDIKEQLNSMHRPMFSEPKFKKVGGSALQSYYLEIDNFLEHTVPSLLYLANQVEKNENKFPNEVYDMILARLSSQTFRNFFESHDYFKRWVENNKDIEDFEGTEVEELPADITPEQIRQSVESEVA